MRSLAGIWPLPARQTASPRAVGEGEAAADVDARARLGIADVVLLTHFDARRQRQAAASLPVDWLSAGSCVPHASSTAQNA